MELWRPTDAEIHRLRNEQLTPEHVVPRLVLCAVNLIALSVGLGKSTLADKLMRSALVRDQFDLVVYAAAQTRILEERVACLTPASCLGRFRDVRAATQERRVWMIENRGPPQGEEPFSHDVGDG